ncbi:MAG: hypothetical protein J5927_02330 [Oscillospiraceae bacterium]|nr:hypothetical protein [Oscillospiraceae bacterium]
MEKELRRCQSNLRILGDSVIVLTLWEFVKAMLLLLLAPAAQTSAAAAKLPFPLPSGKWLLVIGLLILALIPMDIGLRVFIWRSAKAEGSGKPKGKGYMIAAFVLLGFQILGLGQIVVLAVHRNLSSETITSLLVEITSAVIMGELAFTALKYKRLCRQKGR